MIYVHCASGDKKLYLQFLSSNFVFILNLVKISEKVPQTFWLAWNTKPTNIIFNDYLNTGDFMKRVPIATYALTDR